MGSGWGMVRERCCPPELCRCVCGWGGEEQAGPIDIPPRRAGRKTRLGIRSVGCPQRNPELVADPLFPPVRSRTPV